MENVVEIHFLFTSLLKFILGGQNKSPFSISCCRVCPLQRTFRFQCFDLVPLPLISNSFGVNQTPSSFWMHFSEDPFSNFSLCKIPVIRPQITGSVGDWKSTASSLGFSFWGIFFWQLIVELEQTPFFFFSLGPDVWAHSILAFWALVIILEFLVELLFWVAWSTIWGFSWVLCIDEVVPAGPDVWAHLVLAFWVLITTFEFLVESSFLWVSWSTIWSFSWTLWPDEAGPLGSLFFCCLFLWTDHILLFLFFPVLTRGVLAASWSSAGSFGSGESFLITGSWAEGTWGISWASSLSFAWGIRWSLDTGVVLPSWMTLGRALAGPAELGGLSRTLLPCCGIALGWLTLGTGAGHLSGGHWGAGSGSRFWRGFLPVELAGTSKMALSHPPQEATTFLKLLWIASRLGYSRRLIWLNNISRNDRLNGSSSMVRMLYTTLDTGTIFLQASIDSMYIFSEMKDLSRRPSKKGNGLHMA